MLLYGSWAATVKANALPETTPPGGLVMSILLPRLALPGWVLTRRPAGCRQ